ncbi:hypothetical protein ZWY2020_029094 [Hordeum vulgare]|nr:hypothetical protein ZWY2020_029094 [Hordeum vulgare]
MAALKASSAALSAGMQLPFPLPAPTAEAASASASARMMSRSSAAYGMAEELMLEGLEILEKLAKEENLCSKRHSAIILFVSAMSPHHHGVDVGTCSNIVQEVSMRVARPALQLLEATPGEISIELCGHISRKYKLKTSMERIRDCDAKMRALAEKILSQLS